MKLVKIKLCNFGIYENEHEIDFISKNNDRKLTLIIGKNGAGKTTLLNAIRVSFYGSLIFDVKLITSEYKNFILDSLNKNSIKKIDAQYSIAITFISNILSSDGEYTIIREWSIKKDKLNERISIKKYQTELNDIDRDYFLGILHQSYPIELFDLFFFDGEKIDKLSILNKDIVKVLETAFNLTLYKSLKADLEKYAISKSKSSDLIKFENEKFLVDNEIVNFEIVRNKLNDEILSLSDRLYSSKIVMQELSDSGFKFLSNFDDSEIKLAQKELDDLNKLYKTMVTDFIPFTILQNETLKLIEQLNIEKISENNIIFVNELKSISAKDLLESSAVDEISIFKVLNLLISKYEVKGNVLC